MTEPRPKILLSREQYERLSAYRIDPLLSSTVEVTDYVPTRQNREPVLAILVRRGGGRPPRWGNDMYPERGNAMKRTMIHTGFTFGALSVLTALWFGLTFDTPRGEAVSPSVTTTTVATYRIEVAVPSTTSTTVAPTTTIPPTTTTQFVLPGGPWKCPQWHALAYTVGWKAEDIPTLDRIMWRESRCDPTLRSTTADSGLTQINDVHLDWLWDQYGIKQTDLFDPAVNLMVALWMHDYEQQHYGCGWHPWRIQC